MRILFDLSTLNHHHLSGVGVYALNLALALQRMKGAELFGGVRLSRLKRLSTIRSHFKGRIAPFAQSFPIWPWMKFDIFHGPDFRLPRYCSIPRVVTIHDLAVFEDGYSEPEFLERGREVLWNVLERNPPEAVIAASEFTKQEVLRRFPKLKDKTYCVYHGADHLPQNKQGASKSIEDPYFLFVGNLEKRKNVACLVKAFSRVAGQAGFQRHRLVLVGKPGFGFEEIQSEVQSSPAKSRITLLGFLSADELARIFSSALAFVYPSFYEGFGFPILEAMRLGVPVITSRGSSTGEISGGAAILIDPRDEDSLASSMYSMATDDDLREKLKLEGSLLCKSFSWSKCAQETQLIYSLVLDGRFTKFP